MRFNGIAKTRTTAYHPQCDGQVERQNRTLQDMLAAFASEHRDDWDLWIDSVVFAYNTSCHESTGYVLAIRIDIWTYSTHANRA